MALSAGSSHCTGRLVHRSTRNMQPRYRERGFIRTRTTVVEVKFVQCQRLEHFDVTPEVKGEAVGCGDEQMRPRRVPGADPGTHTLDLVAKRFRETVGVGPACHRVLGCTRRGRGDQQFSDGPVLGNGGPNVTFRCTSQRYRNRNFCPSVPRSYSTNDHCDRLSDGVAILRPNHDTVSRALLKFNHSARFGVQDGASCKSESCVCVQR